MRQLERLTPAQSSFPIHLSFAADVVTVINPTAQSIGIVQGGNIPPSAVDNAELWIPPASGGSFPVYGSEFGVAFIPPFLVGAPEGIPTGANLFFIANETVPNFGAFPLSTLATQTLDDDVLFSIREEIAVPSITQQFDLDPSFRSLSLTLNPDNVDSGTDATIIGDQTGYVYWRLPSNASSQLIYSYNCAVFSGLDTSATLTITAPHNTHGWVATLVAHRYAIGPTTSPSGSLSVALSPAFYPLRTTMDGLTISGGSASVQIANTTPLAINESWRKNATQAAVGEVVAPIASQQICGLIVTTTAIYVIEAELRSYESTAKTGLNLKVNGAGCGGTSGASGRTIVVAGRTLPSGTLVSVNCSDYAAGGAGYPYFGSIRIYRID